MIDFKTEAFCPECQTDYPVNPHQSERYRRAGVMLCSSRCTASFDVRVPRRQAA